jgi:4-azaleucine resistance transporter AzlC
MDEGRMAGSKSAIAPAVCDGAKAAWPICLGYVPIGLAFGVLGQKAGLHPWQIAVMSVFVFAGSAQFIAVGMLQAGASAYPIIATTFMVNLRHLLMSSALGVYLRGVNQPFLSLFAYGVTDESFALNLSRFREGDWDRYRGLCLNQTANLAWIASTVTGACAGQFIPAGAMGVDYALTAMFICLLVLQLRGRIHTITALLAGTLAVPLYFILPGNAHVILASILAATAGFALSRWARRKRIRP